MLVKWVFKLMVSAKEPTICNIYLLKKPTIGNMVSYFLQHSKGHLISFVSTWYLQYMNILKKKKLFYRFISVNHHLNNLQVVIFINFVNKGIFSLEQWMQMMIKFQEHRKQGFPIILFNYGHPMLMTNKKTIKIKLLNPRFNIKANIL